MEKNDNKQQGIVGSFINALSGLFFVILKVNDFAVSKTLLQSAKELAETLIGLEIKRENSSDVAQSVEQISFQIKNLINILLIIMGLFTEDKTTPLFAYKNLLKLQLDVLNFKSGLKKLKTRERAVNLSDDNLRFAQLNESGKKSLLEFIKKNYITGGRKEILMFLSERNGPVRNSELFKLLSGVSERTVKRYLSELIEIGVIDRENDGRKVFYLINSEL